LIHFYKRPNSIETRDLESKGARKNMKFSFLQHN